jgi:hypothetical protein
MNTRLTQRSQHALLQALLQTPLVVGLERPEETALALRTLDLFSFRRPALSLTVKPISYQGKKGAWVVAIIFQIAGISTGSLKGAAYLNPRKAHDLQLLQSLIKQERLLILFYSPRRQVVVSRTAMWTIDQRQELRLTLAQMNRAQLGEHLGNEEDPDFDRVRQEFERIYTVKNLLNMSAAGEVRVSSPFKGAVLD